MDLRKIRRELLRVIVEVEGAIDETDSEKIIPVELTQGELWRLEYALGYLIVSSEMPLDGDTCILRDKLIEAYKEAQ